jgi:kynurenine formamidase
MPAAIRWSLAPGRSFGTAGRRLARLLADAVLLAALGQAVLGQAASAAEQGGAPKSLWAFYNSTLKNAKYIDLTHAIAPGGPIGEGFADFKVGPTLAGVAIPGVISKGEPFTYDRLGVAITAYELPMDHIGTQFGPPAHLNEHGATISDIPPTVALRPLVVINIAPKVVRDPGYQATVADIKDWERRHGPIPPGSVVMFRSDWSKRWNDPQRCTWTGIF